MRRLIWLEIKAILRRPAWVLVVCFNGWLFFTELLGGSFAPIIHIGLELPLLGPDTALSSIGELSRALLLMLETFGGIFVVLLTGLMTVGKLDQEWRHREVLWSSCSGTKLRFSLAKLIAVSSLMVSLLALSACAAFLNPSVRKIMAPVGWQFVPFYLALSWIRISLWVAIVIFLFSLTQSKWATVFIAFALHVAWFGTAGIWWKPSFPRLLQRYFMAWGFISVFAPFGIIPYTLFLQGIMLLGLTSALIGAALFVRRRFPEWTGLKISDAKLALVGGIIIALGAGWWIPAKIRSQVAPFTAAALWDGKAAFDRPYIWTRDFRLLVYPGNYTAIILPSDIPLPSWIELLASKRTPYLYRDIKEMILEGHSEEERRVAPASLILLYSAANPYPRELEKLIDKYWQAVSRIVEFCSTCLNSIPKLKLMVLWPPDAFPHCLPVIEGEELRISYACLRYIKSAQLSVAEALLRPLCPKKAERMYIRMFLASQTSFKGDVEKTLTWFRKRAGGDSPSFTVALGSGLHSPAWTPEEAAEVLRHWERGEEMGHKNYICALLKGGQDDQN